MKQLTKQKAFKRIEAFRVKVYLLFIKSTTSGMFDNSVVKYSAILLNYGVWGSKFYDLLLMLYPCIQNYSSWGSDKYYNIVISYRDEISPNEHFSNCKKLIYDMTNLDADINGIILSLISFISLFYADGEIQGLSKDLMPIMSTYNIHSNKDSDTITFYDFLCWHFLNKSFTIMNAETHQPFELSLNKGLVGMIKECHSVAYSKIKQDTIRELAEKLESSELFSWFISQYPALFCSKLWISSPLPNSGCGAMYRWEREDFRLGKTSDTNLIIFQILQDLPDNILMHRKFYIRESGVIVKFKYPSDPQIKYLHMIETHENGYDCVVISYEVNNAVRSIPLFIENFTSSIKFILYELDLVVIPIILSVLGVASWLINNIQIINLPKNNENKDISAEEYRTAVRDTLQLWIEVTEKQSIYYEEPVNWNYESRSAKPLRSNDTKIIGTRKVTVGRYTRKLPEGYHASSEARMLATKYKMILEPGYTFVDEFEKDVPVRATSEF